MQWVSDTIGETYKKWKRGDIVTIQAQTGTGKTEFIKQKIIDNMECYETMLYVCNRTNLKRQFKKDLLIKYNKPVPKIKDTDDIDIEILDKITKIGNIIITSYHAIQDTLLKQEYAEGICDLSQFNYIILDEVHFLFADAGFNNRCRFVYQEFIENYHHNAIQIFISATMEEVIPVIEANVKRFKFSKPNVRHYTTGIDYSYLNVRYLDNNLDDIVNMIKNDESDEKWLIFVTQKADAKYISENVGKDKSSIIISGTKSKELDNIINNSCFENKTLLCTKAMDNGINIKSDKLTNIIIMAWDRITFLQELGRKRIDIQDAQTINLYIPMRYKKSFRSKINNCQKFFNIIDLLQKDENEFNKAYDNNLKNVAELNNLIYRDQVTGKWTVNDIGYARLIKDNAFYVFMVEKFDKEDEFAFIRQQLEWMGLQHTFNESNLIKDVMSIEEKETLESYLESMLGKVMLQAKDRKELIEKIGLVDPHNSSTKKGNVVYLKNRDTLNNYLEKEIKSNFYIKQFSTTKKVDSVKKTYKQAWKVMLLTDKKSKKKSKKIS